MKSMLAYKYNEGVKKEKYNSDKNRLEEEVSVSSKVMSVFTG